MGQYEWIFVVEGVTQDIVDDVYSEYDALFSEHDGQRLLTVTFDGDSASEAARLGVNALTARYSLRMLRSYADLVSRSDIAERTSSTAQAVGQWVRGDRLRKTPFPRPYNHVAGGIWLWGSVNDWLRKVGKPCETEIRYPTHSDHVVIDLWLTARQGFHPRHSISGGGRGWRGTVRSGQARLTTAKPSERLDWTGTDYAIVG